MKTVAVLGAGMVGGHIARDLSTAFEVTSVDRDEAALRDLSWRTHVADLRDAEVLRRLVEPFDLVVDAVPGFMGFSVLETLIGAGKNVVDIAFFPEDPFALDDLARERGVTVVVDCGVAPGMSNVLLGHETERLAKVRSFLCLVGGLPVERSLPFQYKAPFSPCDVIEEYTRPARMIEAGRVVHREALSDPELFEVPGVGTLEALNTDGLRTLAVTFPDIPDMKEKTLRYPGHAELMRALRDGGFFDAEAIEIEGVMVRPLDFTSRILFDSWKLDPGEEEFTVMQVVIEGETSDGQPETIVYDLLDVTDPQTGVSSMARTTGYPAAACVHLLADGLFKRPGVSAPEHVGADPECFKFILDYQRERGVEYELS